MPNIIRKLVYKWKVKQIMKRWDERNKRHTDAWLKQSGALSDGQYEFYMRSDKEYFEGLLTQLKERYHD